MDSAVFDDGTGPALYLAGDFTKLHGELACSVIRYDGVEWSPLEGGLFNNDNQATVRALEVFDADGAGSQGAVLAG